MIIHDRPPIFARILAAFPRADYPGVLFAYDGNIYNPSGIHIPSPLIAHETVHLTRQKMPGTDPDDWWTHYIEDSGFRYHEELLAHAAEMQTYFQVPGDRNARARILTYTAGRLVAPLYNYQPPRTFAHAIGDLRNEVEHEQRT